MSALYNNVDVYMGYRIYSLKDVNDKQQTFNCDFRIFASWEDSTLPSELENSEDLLEEKQAWRPFIDIANALHLDVVDSGFRSDGPGRYW